MLRPLALVAVATFTAAAAEPPAATVTTKYKVVQQVAQEIDASALGGGKQNTSQGFTTFLTITLADTAGGRTVRAIVDSMVAEASMGIPQAALDSVKGTVVTALLAPTGKMTNVALDRESILGQQAKSLVDGFFPKIKSGAAKAGDAWTDTTETTNELPNGSIVTRAVTNYKASSEAKDGTPAIRLDGASAASMSGSQETPGGPATIDGTGTGTSTYYVSAAGTYLGGESKQSANLQLSLQQAPAPIPVLITTTTTVSVLK